MYSPDARSAVTAFRQHSDAAGLCSRPFYSGMPYDDKSFGVSDKRSRLPSSEGASTRPQTAGMVMHCRTCGRRARYAISMASLFDLHFVTSGSIESREAAVSVVSEATATETASE